TAKVFAVHNPIFWYVHRVLAHIVSCHYAKMGGIQSEECMLLWAMYSRIRADVASHKLHHWMFHAVRASGTISFGGLLTPIAKTVWMDLSTLSPFPGDIPTIDLQYVILTDKFDLQERAYYLKI
ncbi:hypothetical protein Droror1_Dr00002286, partial [Drosera rotundifolia]